MKLLASFGALFAAAFFTVPAHAQCAFYLKDGSCGPTVNSPGTGTGLDANRGLLRIVPPPKKELVKNALYTVNLTCKKVAYQSVNDKWGLFVNKQRVTSHTIALTKQRLAQSQIPTDAKIAIVVYSVSDGAQNKSNFINSGCNSSFVIAGKEPIFLAATATQGDTNTPGVLTNVIFELVKLTSSVVPLFTGTTWASHWAPSFSATTSDQSTLNDIIGQLNKGNTETTPSDLYEGKTTVSTPYSQVDIVISRIKSLVELGNLPGNSRFLSDFETSIETSKPQLKLETAIEDTIEGTCKSYAGDLIARNLSTSDIAYALAYVSLLYQFERDKTLDCLGPHYARPALLHTDIWDREADGKAPYSEPDAKTRWQGADIALPAQPKFTAGTKDLLEHAQDTLGAYVQADPQSGPTTQQMGQYFSQSLIIEDIAGLNFGSKVVPLDQFAKKFAETFTHVGCVTSDTEGAAVFFGFKGKGANGAWTPSEAVSFQVWLNDQARIGWMEVKTDEAASLLEKALQARNSRTCNSVTVKKSGD